jgi:hypothetical protein
LLVVTTARVLRAELLRLLGWIINDKRVERIWRREGPTGSVQNLSHFWFG